ncbi:hypothetical protein SARC_02947 [Sphaeroforma arctica JP610]|uniref:Uncharacterized protein n=1 Tax=Sphaeroforma arctica JP610 TaxID=667725 RepID=A0A0L0G7H9_9EUKA|nr:hypothetical protein SARC_02947 [Sphaeroforma arctica JP610]KNC84836.1 hypothetical protein SARC_02947 [Sphaeroforma arctica JP610]|eukprot:XP_014158738.1 hypothetical protein SARC_02947 [Sphaeroforma arctica JP610]
MDLIHPSHLLSLSSFIPHARPGELDAPDWGCRRETELHGGNNAPNTSTSTHSHSHPGHEVGVSAREGTDRDAVSVHLTTPERLDRAQIQQAQPLLQQQLAESESKTEIKPTSASDDEEMRQIEVEQALLQVMDNASPSITAQMSTNNDTATAQQQPDPLGVGISSQHTRKLTDTNSADELKSLREAIDERGSFIHHKRTSPPTSSTPPPRLISARGPHMGVPNDRNRTGATSAVQLPVIAAMASAADGDDAEYQKLLQRHRAQGDTAASIFGTRSDEDILPTSSVGSIQPQPQPKPNPNPTATLSPKVIGGGPTVNRGLPNASSTANQVFTKEPMAYSTAAEAKQGANNMSQNSAPDPSENGPKRVLTHKVLPATGDKAAEAVYRLPMGSPGSRNKLSPTLQATQQMPQINSQSRKHTLTDTPTHHTAHPPPGQGQANPKAKVRPTWEADNRATHSGVRPTQITRTKAATGRGARIISKVLTHARLSAAGGAKTKAGLHIGPALDTGLSGGANMIILGDDDADTTTNTNAHGPKTQTTPDDSEAIVID